MTDALYRGEAWLRNWSDTAKGGRRITLQIDEDGTHPFKGYSGERFAVVIVPLGNDDQPMKKAEPVDEQKHGKIQALAQARKAEASKPPRQKWREMRPSARAALLIKDVEFWEWITRTFGYGPCCDAADADHVLKGECNIESKRDLDHEANKPNLLMFQRLEDNFFTWRNARQMGAA